MSVELELLVITNRFKADSTKTGKEALLLEYINNEDFRKYLKYILDPSLNYGLQDKKIKKFLGKSKVTEQLGFKRNIFSVFEYLIQNPTGSDKDAMAIAYFIDSFKGEEDVQKFILESITKKIRLGVTAKSVNKIYGKDFLPQIEVMLAKKYEDEFSKIQNCEFVITEKYDGMRCLCVKNEEGINFYTRQGNKILGLIEIEESMSKLQNGCYDGELLISSHDSLRNRDVLQETLKITRKDGEKRGVDFYIFDYITEKCLENGKSKDIYEQRRDFLESIEYGCNLVLVPILYKGSDHDVIPSMLKEMEDKGKEGLMLNLIGNKSYYECRRTHNILKIKTMQTVDLRVIGFEEGSGKHKGSLGALICNYKGFELKVGSGLTDEDRREFFDNQEKYLNKIITVQYFRESSNDKGGLSVSFPVYICIRDDKKEESYY